MFLTTEDLIRLTGKRQKSAQIDQLRKMGLPFFVNASGHPVVAESAVQGKKPDKPTKTWEPSWGGNLANT